MNELIHIYNEYLCAAKGIANNGFHVITERSFYDALHGLVPYERPDMYAVLEDKIIIFEHFAFDSSRSIRRSMTGMQEEAHLERRISSSISDDQIHIDKADYEISFSYWQENFERCFQNHYDKIGEYKEKVVTYLGDTGKKIITGFFIENKYAPYVHVSKKMFALPYVCTTQFCSKFINSPNIDFVVYGYYDGWPKLIYIDRDGLHKQSRLYDLTSKDITLSHLNSNEVTAWGMF